MHRRRFLAAAAAVLPGLSGCAVGYRGTPTPTYGTDIPLARLGYPADVCEEQTNPELILAIDEPAFAADWSGVETNRYPSGLADEDVVVGLTAGDRTRAYPVSVLAWHEVVNDQFDGPTLITYCPLCDSGLVAERRVSGRATIFRVSGLLWDPPDLAARAREDDGTVFGVTRGETDVEVRPSGNLVLVDDATGSRWSQLLARAICGPRRGDRLTALPSTTATWGSWRQEHPETEVLLPPPHSGTV